MQHDDTTARRSGESVLPRASSDSDAAGEQPEMSSPIMEVRVRRSPERRPSPERRNLSPPRLNLEIVEDSSLKSSSLRKELSLSRGGMRAPANSGGSSPVTWSIDRDTRKHAQQNQSRSKASHDEYRLTPDMGFFICDVRHHHHNVDVIRAQAGAGSKTTQDRFGIQQCRAMPRVKTAQSYGGDRAPSRNKPPINPADRRRGIEACHSPPFEKKPKYPVLVNVTTVESALPDVPSNAARSTNKTKISRSLFVSSGEDASNVSSSAHYEASLDSLAAVQAIKDLALPPHLLVPGKKMTEQETAAWLDRWVDCFNVEQGMFTSGSNFTEIKFQEMAEAESVSALRKGHVSEGKKDDHKPNAFRTAVCFNLLDRICPQLGTFAPIVKKLRDEIAKSVYAGLEVADIERSLDKRSNELHYAFKTAPYFVDNVRLLETIQVMRDGYQEAMARMHRAEEKAKLAQDEILNLEARLDGFRMQVQTLETELSHAEEERARKESQLLAEMQQLRDKIIAGAIAAAQLRANAGNTSEDGGGVDSRVRDGGGEFGGVVVVPVDDNPGESELKVQTTSRVEAEMSNLVIKETLEYMQKFTIEAVSAMEQEVAQYAAVVDMWRKISTETHDPSLILRHGDSLKHLPRMQLPDILLRWVEYQMKQSRRTLILDGPIKPNNFTTDMQDGVMLMQVIQQCMPAELQLSSEEIATICKGTLDMRMQRIGQKLCEFTGDPKWMVIDLCSTQPIARIEVLMMLMVTRPSLAGSVFGEGKLLQNMMTEIQDRFENVNENFAQFTKHIKSSVISCKAMDVVSMELLLRGLADCRLHLGKLAQHLPVVAEELQTVKQTFGLTLNRMVCYLQERSNHKIVPGSEVDKETDQEEGVDEADKGTEKSKKEESAIHIIKPVTSVSGNVEILPGKFAQMKMNLTKAARQMIANLQTEKVKDTLDSFNYEDQVRILEKCAEAAIVNYNLLRSTFRHYCKVFKSSNTLLVQSGGAAMSLQSWQLLMSDIKILGPEVNCPKHLMHPDVSTKVFEVANYVIDYKTGKYAPGRGLAELEVQEFVEALVRVASEWGKQLRKEVVFTFQTVLAAIELNAKTEQSGQFRLACRSEEVEKVLIQYSRELMYTYKVYAGMDTTENDDDGSAKLDSMNLVEFMTLMKDSGIQDINLTKPEIVNMFIYVQDDGSVVNQDTDDGQVASSHGHEGIVCGQPMADDTEMDYSEFCESLCGCACYKTLDPYVTIPQKLELLIIKNILPLCNALKNGKKPSLASDKLHSSEISRTASAHAIGSPPSITDQGSIEMI